MKRPLAFLALLAAIPCLADSPSLQGFDYSQTHGRYVLILNLDGLSEQVFHEQLRQGRLKNLERLIRDKGGVVGRLVSAFPSSTTPAIPEFFSGRFLDRSASLPRKVHAFDRESQSALRYTFKNRDWKDDEIDIWDICQDGGIPTATFFLTGYKGVGKNHFRRFYLAFDSLFELMRLTFLMNFDRRSIRDAAKMYRTAKTPPQLCYLWCDTLDITGHLHGPYSRTYRHSLRSIDQALGGLFKVLRKRRLPPGDSLYDRMTVLLFGDHGLSPSHQRIPVARFFRQQGLKLRDLSLPSQFLLEYLGIRWAEKVDAIFVPGGSSVAELYLRHYSRDRTSPREPWTSRLSAGTFRRFKTPRHPGGIDLVRGLSALPGMDVVLAKEAPGTVRVVGQAGDEAVVSLQASADGEERFAYMTVDGGDPLGYLDVGPARRLVSSLAEPRFYEAADWLHATIASQHPYAVPRLPRAFGSHPTESDLILVSRSGFDFISPSKGDHGGLAPDTMITPLLVAGAAGAPSIEPPLLTSVDIMPTLLELLGIRPPARFTNCLDGNALSIPDRQGK